MREAKVFHSLFLSPLTQSTATTRHMIVGPALFRMQEMLPCVCGSQWLTVRMLPWYFASLVFKLLQLSLSGIYSLLSIKAFFFFFFLNTRREGGWNQRGKAVSLPGCSLLSLWLILRKAEDFGNLPAVPLRQLSWHFQTFKKIFSGSKRCFSNCSFPPSGPA